MSQRRAHFVLSTHWDREWREPFQVLRYDLVRLLDRVLAGLQDGRLQGPFVTDGQSIVIEDYLEVRPERREEVARLARERKLVIGPWYTLPDEFTVSGESLIRNLHLGREVVRSLGAEPSCAGYVPDMFGHNSQLPQIFAGFGIAVGFIWRGVNSDRRNLLWRGADGTVLLCHKFGTHGYGSYAFYVRRGHDFKETAYDPAAFAARLERYLEDEAAHSDVEPILVLDSSDHQEWDQAAYALVRERMARPDDRFLLIHSDLDAYASEFLAQRDRVKTIVEGELRAPGRQTRAPGQDPMTVDQQWVIPGVLSSRVNLKQANRRCEALLCQWAEPFSAFASAVTGLEYPQGFLSVAWRYLLTNHAHDSIDGCSIDQVHKDMMHRFDQCRLIADHLAREATHRLAAGVAGDVAEDELRVAVFNPLPRPFGSVTELTLQIPPEWPTFNEFFGYEPKPAFRVYGPDGQEIPYQRLAQAMNQIKHRIRPTKFVQDYRTHDVSIALPLTVPATGYTTLTVRAEHPGSPPRHPETPGLAVSECAMANEFLRVEIAPNGTLTLTDKRTGQVYQRLLTFEDRADIGDGWYHGLAVNDQVFTSTACRAEVALVHDGPYLTTFRIRTTMAVPEAFRFDRMVRSEQMTDLVIDSLVSLRPGQDYLDVRTTVHNTADDHRLRVLFPTGAAGATTYLADSPFDVVERPIALQPDRHLYRELEVETRPQQSWTAVYDGRRGLAVAADALLETAVRDLPERTLALTLFRGTRRTPYTEGEPDGQVRGRLEFAYRIVPLAAAPERARLCEMGQLLSAGLRVAQLRPEDLPLYRSEPTLPPTASFLRLEGPAVITSARQVGDGLEVRLFNPEPLPVSAMLHLWPAAGPRTVQRVDLESRGLEEPRAVGDEVALTLGAKQIVTLRIA